MWGCDNLVLNALGGQRTLQRAFCIASAVLSISAKQMATLVGAVHRTARAIAVNRPTSGKWIQPSLWTKLVAVVAAAIGCGVSAVSDRGYRARALQHACENYTHEFGAGRPIRE